MFLPEYIRDQLRAAGKRAFDARMKLNYMGPEYQQAINDIDAITRSAREQFPRLFQQETEQGKTVKATS